MKSMELSDKLKKLMERDRLSERRLGSRLKDFNGHEVSSTTIHRWRAGDQVPDIREALALARIFGVAIEMLADDERDLEMQPDEAGEIYLLRLARKIGIDNAIAILAPLAKEITDVPPVPQANRIERKQPATPHPRGRGKTGQSSG